MHFSEIDVEETHIRLTADISNHNLKHFIYNLRSQLKSYIRRNQDFLLSFEPVKQIDEKAPAIVHKMQESSTLADVGPMACVAGTISEMSLNYLIGLNSKYSVVENGGDIALINNKKLLCGIYSNNTVLGNTIAFEIKPRKEPLGICTSSGKIGHSISFGEADSVTVISKSPSLADGLATRIANEVHGNTGEDKITNALESADRFKEFYQGVLIISDNHVGTAGKLPKIVETKEFEKNSKDIFTK